MIDPFSLGLHVTHVTGSEAYCVCPFHNDNSPSASFNMDKGVFHCYACGKNASAKTLATELGGYIIQTSEVHKARERDDDEWEWILLAPLALNNSYLQRRGVSNKLVERFGLRALKSGVAFLNHDLNGRVIGAQIRRFEGYPRYLFYGKKAELWPIENAFTNVKPVFVVEGVFGVLRATDAGLTAVATMSAGTINGTAKILNGREKIIAFDNDFAGHLGAAKFLSITNASAVLPGFEADEISIQDWQQIKTKFQIARHWSEFLKVTSDPKRLKLSVEHFMQKSSKVTRWTSPASPRYV